jgi:nitronate monooxygenase
MGAAGAWVGTPFAATEEAVGVEAAKQAILVARETDTVHTHVYDIVQEAPWPDAYPGRALANAFVQRWHGKEEALLAGLKDAQAEFADAWKRLDFATAHIYAGQSAGLVNEIVPAGDLVRSLMSGAEATLRENLGRVLP